MQCRSHKKRSFLNGLQRHRVFKSCRANRRDVDSVIRVKNDIPIMVAKRCHCAQGEVVHDSSYSKENNLLLCGCRRRRMDRDRCYWFPIDTIHCQLTPSTACQLTPSTAAILCANGSPRWDMSATRIGTREHVLDTDRHARTCPRVGPINYNFFEL